MGRQAERGRHWLEGYYPPDMDAVGGWDVWRWSWRPSLRGQDGDWVYFSGGAYSEPEARDALKELRGLAARASDESDIPADPAA